MGRPRAPLDPGLRSRVEGHLTVYPGLSVYDIARALGLEDYRGTGKERVTRELLELYRQGTAVPVKERADEHDRRLVTRWYLTIELSFSYRSTVIVRFGVCLFHAGNARNTAYDPAGGR